MSEFITETSRAEQGVLSRDFVDMSPEAVRLREMIDAIGSFAVVAAKSGIDVAKAIAFNGE